MCFGGSAPAAPEIKYVGPSEDDIKRNQESLDAFQAQMNEQQAAFQTALQEQIDRADQEYADLESKYATDLATANQAAANQQTAAQNAANANVANAQSGANAAVADAQKAKDAAAAQAASDMNSAAAAGAAQQVGAYKVSVTQSEPVNAQETKAITDKKKPKSTLKISQNAVEAAAGTGLNIGV